MKTIAFSAALATSQAALVDKMEPVAPHVSLTLAQTESEAESHCLPRGVPKFGTGPILPQEVGGLFASYKCYLENNMWLYWESYNMNHRSHNRADLL